MTASMPARLSTLTDGISVGRDPSHRATTGTCDVAQVLDDARLVAHVAQQDDGVAVARLEDGPQRDRLVGAGVGGAQDHVVAAPASLV